MFVYTFGCTISECASAIVCSCYIQFICHIFIYGYLVLEINECSFRMLKVWLVWVSEKLKFKITRLLCCNVIRSKFYPLQIPYGWMNDLITPLYAISFNNSSIIDSWFPFKKSSVWSVYQSVYFGGFFLQNKLKYSKSEKKHVFE